jgi:hypothetical protein
MRFPRKRGSTSNMVRIFVPDNTSTKGAGKTGLSSGSINLVIAYIRTLDSAATTYTGANIQAQTTIGTFQQPTDSAHVRFKEVDSANFPGLYELQFHDSATAFGSGDASDAIEINILETSTTALNIGPNMCLIPLVPWDYQDGVRMGLTALPNAAANAAGGLPISIAGGLDLDEMNADIEIIQGFGAPPSAAAIATAIFTDTTASDFAVNGSPGKILVTQLGGTFTSQSSSVFTAAALVNGPTGSAPTAAQIATAIWQDLTAGADFSVAGSIGNLLVTNINLPLMSIQANVWEELFGSHTTVNSMGWFIGTILRSGLMAASSTLPTQTGATSTTLIVNGTAASLSRYVGASVRIFAGTGAIQERRIKAVTLNVPVGNSTLTIDWPWVTQPAAGDSYLFAAGDGAAVDASLGVTVGGYEAGQDPGTLVGAISVAGKTLIKALVYIGATTAGTLPSGAGSGQENWKDFAGNPAVDITCDSSGNRTTIVYH